MRKKRELERKKRRKGREKKGKKKKKKKGKREILPIPWGDAPIPCAEKEEVPYRGVGFSRFVYYRCRTGQSLQERYSSRTPGASAA